ncbi:CHAT domain-containing protein [Cladophialophora immunda]|nr:CHAT domain-containing protein [Cladophialophora immunda]
MAIKRAEEAIRVTPPGHPDLAGRLNNLSNKLESRYERVGNMADLETAISKAEEVVRVTPPGYHGLAGRLNNLGTKLERRYERTGNMADLEMAIEKAEEAVRITPADHPDLAAWLKNLGQMRLLHPDPSSSTDALALFLRSWDCHAGVPSYRLRSALDAINIFVGQKRWTEAADLSIEAIDLLPLMNRRTLSRDDQQHTLAMFTGLAAKASSLSLQCGRPVERSVEILEQGRGAILGLLIDDRSDISPLYNSYPEQAAEYDRLRMEVNTDPAEYHTGELSEQMRKWRTKAVQELEECIDHIRHLPGYERFLLSASVKELQQQAAAGPIIFVNVNDIRSDAIIITSDRIQLLPLPAFSAKVLRSWKRDRLTEFSRSDFGKKNKKHRIFLSWLWDACVQPIVVLLRPLDKTCGAVSPVLRAWWIGTGEANAVPFHAAGNHSPGSSDNTISHMVSSYTPTIKALAFSRQRLAQCRRLVATGKAVGGTPSLVVATMPQTPGMAPLPGVENEVSSISTAAITTFSINHLPSPSAADIKTKLTTCHVFHFAGHGITNVDDPSRGSLVLQRSRGPNTEAQRDFLSVLDTVGLHLSHAQLAYLSACSTAENRASQLADEVIHLVSGFQVAGFPHVVGSMWQSADRICADMAYLFYQRICAVDEGLVGDGSVARALHGAVSEVRKRCPEEPLLWAQYVHFGG